MAFKKSLDFVGIDDETRHTLRAFWPAVRKNLPALLAGFYAKIATVPHLAAMIGNDIVDLKDPDTRPETFRPRFDERVFDAAERRAIARDADPHKRRWAHWAAKEASYKLGRQVDEDFVFTPSRLVARFESIESEEGGRTIRKGTLALPRSIAPGFGHLELRSD